MAIGSVGAYLAVRYAKEYKIPNSLVNFANFLIPTIVFLVIIIKSERSFILKPELICLLFVFGVFATYIGTNISLKAMKLAGNPGLSLIIQKSYAVFTSIAAYFLFGSELSAKNFAAIILIVASVFIMNYEKSNLYVSTKRSLFKKYWWIFLSIIASLIWASNALMAKYLILQGVDIYVRLFYVNLFACLTGVINIFIQRSTLSIIKPKHFLVLSAVGGFFTIFYVFMQMAYEVSPNIGYVNIINTASITVLTLLSSFIFKDKINLQKILGILGVTLGVIMIFLK
jgi:drug/metabolite transporter (DMT)-like permease